MAQAHEFWLAARPPNAAAGDTVEVQAFVGTGFRGELKPYATPRTIHLQLRTVRTIDLTPGARNGDLAFAHFITPDAGGALVAYESNFAFIELAAPLFDRYLKNEGLDEAASARRAAGAAKPDAASPGRERYARCAKVWIAGTDAKRVCEPVGQTIEIVPLADPVTAASFRCRVWYEGKPLAGALVRAWRNPRSERGAAERDSVPPTAEVRSTADGSATLALDAPGEWLVNAVHMIPSTDATAADWQSYWASIAFIRPENPAAAKPR
jgi:hypothetical protein